MVKLGEGLCRLCANDCEKGTDLKEKTSIGNSLLEVVNRYLHLNILLEEEKDELPRQICAACSLNVEIIVQFLDLIKDGQQRFKDLCQQKSSVPEIPLITYKPSADDVYDLMSDDDDAMPELESLDNSAQSPPKKVFHGTLQTVEGFIFGNIEIQSARACVFNCNICEAPFKAEAELGRHNAKHRSTIFECSVCSERFASKAELHQHHTFMQHFGELMIETGTAAYNTTMGCKFCGIDFVSVDDLVRHSQLAHSNQFMYGCSKCTRTFDSLSVFICHARQHDVAEERLCIGCGTRFRSQASYQQHQAGGDCSGVFRCTKCSKTFTKKNSLVAHMRLHNENTAFKCQICSGRFAYHRELAIHLKTHGQGDYEFVCTVCAEKFDTQYELKRHRMKKHKQDANKVVRQMSCSICGQSHFKDLTELVQHIKTHDSEEKKQFTCPICTKVFIGNYKFKQHLQVHGEKVYVCTLCGKRFNTEEYLRLHTKRHEAKTKSKTTQRTESSKKITDSVSITPASSIASPASVEQALGTIEPDVFNFDNAGSSVGTSNQRTVSMSTDDGQEEHMEPIDFDQLINEKMVEVYSDEDLDDLDFERQLGGNKVLFVIRDKGQKYEKAEVEELGSSIKMGGSVDNKPKQQLNQKQNNIVVDDNLPVD